jgi:hypothetical protein
MKGIRKELVSVILIFMLSFLYAWLRYVVFGPYTSHDLLFILNKASAFTVVLNTFVAYSPVRLSQLNRKIIGIASFYTALLHVILSLVLLPTGYYKAYHFDTGKLSPAFGLAVFFGILALLTLIAIFLYFKTRPRKEVNYRIFKQLTSIYYVFLALHIFLLGYKHWIHIRGWYGGFPPITLISFILLLASWPLVMYFMRKKMQPGDENQAPSTD